MLLRNHEFRSSLTKYTKFTVWQCAASLVADRARFWGGTACWGALKCGECLTFGSLGFLALSCLLISSGAEGADVEYHWGGCDPMAKDWEIRLSTDVLMGKRGAKEARLMHHAWCLSMTL